MNALINDVNVEFVVENEAVFCDTLQIAQVFEQEHKNVLQTIKNLPFSEFNEQNFKLVSYKDSRGAKTALLQPNPRWLFITRYGLYRAKSLSVENRVYQSF